MNARKLPFKLIVHELFSRLVVCFNELNRVEGSGGVTCVNIGKLLQIMVALLRGIIMLLIIW